mmetsp:Transcript_14941/g.33947  ORF Transcript_14941/g.33947 Transcript_14941/m.33947 type:complete len:290 (-) Transcript_14941:3148-4017(-)
MIIVLTVVVVTVVTTTTTILLHNNNNSNKKFTCPRKTCSPLPPVETTAIAATLTTTTTLPTMPPLWMIEMCGKIPNAVASYHPRNKTLLEEEPVSNRRPIFLPRRFDSGGSRPNRNPKRKKKATKCRPPLCKSPILPTTCGGCFLSWPMCDWLANTIWPRNRNNRHCPNKPTPGRCKRSMVDCRRSASCCIRAKPRTIWWRDTFKRNPNSLWNWSKCCNPPCPPCTWHPHPWHTTTTTITTTATRQQRQEQHRHHHHHPCHCSTRMPWHTWRKGHNPFPIRFDCWPWNV